MSEKILDFNYGLSKNQLKKTTATVADVISGKKFYDSAGSLVSGTLVEQGAYVPSVDNPYMYEGVLCVNFPLGAYRTKVSGQTGSQVQVAQSAVANAIGLTADKLMSGQTVLGIAGTGGTNFWAADSKNKNGGSVELRRDEGNHLAYGHTVASAACTISGRSAHVVASAYFHVDNNGTSGVIGDGNHSAVTIDFWVYF